jgi:hypothetical protein
VVGVQKVKVYLKDLKQSTLIEILKENYKRENIFDLLEIRIITLYLLNENENVNFSPLSEIFEI